MVNKEEEGQASGGREGGRGRRREPEGKGKGERIFMKTNIYNLCPYSFTPSNLFSRKHLHRWTKI